MENNVYSDETDHGMKCEMYHPLFDVTPCRDRINACDKAHDTALSATDSVDGPCRGHKE